MACSLCIIKTISFLVTFFHKVPSCYRNSKLFKLFGIILVFWLVYLPNFT
uniref:Uncharacterized protein n=1 Tax=Arundo donax TaxID=35708 RepID=A0A0A9A5N9_ARUDO